MSENSSSLKDSALAYHRAAPGGKLSIVATKPLENQRDLALAYSPGVAAACEAIMADKREADHLTARGNLVAVITNGTAVLGLGNIGPLASKPVMEGKAVLFKKFADIDAIDIEVECQDPKQFCDIVASLEPSFGGVNLEDIKAPDCFVIEAELRRRMNIPVFHDDQHGTAIIVAAMVLNWLRYSGRQIDQIRLVTSGAGAAATACLDLLVDLGMPVENIWVTDINGVVHVGREDIGPEDRRARYAKETPHRRLDQVIEGADVFLGLSAPRVLSKQAAATMAPRPLVLALANPTPEIMPEELKEVRDDAIIATGRSDYPNQVNNVLCFPYIFRGAIDVGATEVNEAMKVAATRAIADLAVKEVSDVAAAAYGDETLSFGPDYLIPKPFDPRLIMEIAPAVAQAAMDSGLATRPIEDMAAYRARLSQFVYRSGLVMKPIFAKAKESPARVVFAEGEEQKVLQAVQVALDEGLAKPILIGRRDVVETRRRRNNLRFILDKDVELVDPEDDPRYRDYWMTYHDLVGRRGVSPAIARDRVRTNPTVIGALMIEKGDADAMLCGVTGRFHDHLSYVREISGLDRGVRHLSALSGVILSSGLMFLADTYVENHPTSEELAETALQASDVVRSFGMEPKVALLSHSNFGSHDSESALRMRAALGMILANDPELAVDGEMGATAALNAAYRAELLNSSTLEGEANLLLFPNLDAANIAYSMLREVSNGLGMGPILLGCRRPVHVLTPSISARGLVNMAAMASVQVAQRTPKEDQTAAAE